MNMNMNMNMNMARCISPIEATIRRVASSCEHFRDATSAMRAETSATCAARRCANEAGERNDGSTGSCVSIAVLISSPVTRWSPRWSSAEAADGRRSGWCGVPTDERRRDDASVPLSCALISEGGRREDDTDDTEPASDGGAGDRLAVSAALATSESGVERAEPDDGGEKASSREEEWSGALQRHAIWGTTRWLLLRRGERLRRRTTGAIRLVA